MMRDAAVRLARWADPRPRRAGRRGAFLLFLAILDAAYGYSLLVPVSAAAAGAVRSQYPVLPQHAWALIWLAMAGVCASGILAWDDRLQFGAAALIKGTWAARSAYLWYRHVPLAWVSVTVWTAFAATVLVIASWPDPAPGRRGKPS